MPRPPEACAACLRRTRLVALLAPYIELARRERSLPQILALDDDALLAAVAGRRQDTVRARLKRPAPVPATGAPPLRTICRHDPAYPRRLLDAADAPAVLHVRGDATVLAAEPAVAVVGARRASPYGLEVARGLGRGLAAAGLPVVSGMALGVDGAAHAGALEAGGPTIAVLAGGADVPYPRSKAGLYRVIAQAPGCCVVSEMPPGFAPFKWGFPARNRIIAGLADMTVVVEAAARSGSLITAEMAQDAGRVVAAVPGAVTNPVAEGTNALLRDGAELVRGPQDVLDALLGAGASRVAAGPDPARLEPRLRGLLEHLAGDPATPSGLVGRGAGEADDVVAGLVELELLGFARRVPGGGYVRTAS